MAGVQLLSNRLESSRPPTPAPAPLRRHFDYKVPANREDFERELGAFYESKGAKLGEPSLEKHKVRVVECPARWGRGLIHACLST